ncbi:MAG: Digeranylgeranylglycerophospholipid reductase [Ktedonobacterales bacterium]|jgi:digeranylgeranylglycerophospholipid reductase|nr:MAG: Digeranylgeranylglycerophospholipid reductase [Ktedonobacterales bacterium]
MTAADAVRTSERDEARRYDVLVVGGGPSGLAAAEAAALGGARVALLERQKEIGYPIHTSGGSWVSDMRVLGIPSDLYHPIRSVTFLSPRKSATFAYDDPVCCVLDVRGVYQHLAGRTVKAGAELHPNSPVEGPILEDGRVVGVVAKDHRNRPGEWRAPVVIDASGFSCTLSTRANLHAGYRRYGYGAEYDLYAPNYDPDSLYLIMGSQVAPSGYAWAFPRGKGRVRLGVGVIRPDVDADAREYLDTFSERLPSLAPAFAGASAVEYHTGLFPSEGVVPHFVGEGLLATGDAAGHGSTLVGEGIRFAIYSGQMAGAVAAEATRAGDASARFLERYERQWRARFGREMDISYMVNQRIAAWSDTRWDESMDLLNRLTPAQAAELLRGDYSVGLFLGVLRRNPGLLRSGARKFFDVAFQRLGRPTPVTEAEIATSGA